MYLALAVDEGGAEDDALPVGEPLGMSLCSYWGFLSEGFWGEGSSRKRARTGACTHIRTHPTHKRHRPKAHPKTTHSPPSPPKTYCSSTAASARCFPWKYPLRTNSGRLFSTVETYTKRSTPAWLVGW